MNELVYKVALALGSVLLLTVCLNFTMHQTFGLGGCVLALVGLLLVGLSIWRKIDVSVSDQGFSAKLERVEAEVKAAAEVAQQSSASAEQAKVAVSRLRHSLQVESAQIALAGLGFRVFADGLIGPQTRQAIRDFQQSQGLPASGELDRATLMALKVPTLESGT